MAEMLAIQVKNLKKYFGEVKAVDGMDLEVPLGRVVALLGPNGAGKTTTINLITTQITPDGGVAEVMGIDVVSHSKQARKKIGITFQETSVDPALTGRQVLHFSGELYGMRRKAIKARTEELLALVGLSEAAKRKTKTYSGGMKRRLELVRSLMNTPEVLILDEPTLGLDPQTRAKIWEYINLMKNKHQMSILLTTHYMDEAEQLADYIYIIDNGKIVKDGEPDSLIRELGDDTVRLLSAGDMTEFAANLKEQDYVQSLSISGGESMHIGVDSGQKRVPEILKLALDHGVVINEVAIDRPNLGDVFFSITGREMRD